MENYCRVIRINTPHGRYCKHHSLSGICPILSISYQKVKGIGRIPVYTCPYYNVILGYSQGETQLEDVVEKCGDCIIGGNNE